MGKEVLICFFFDPVQSKETTIHFFGEFGKVKSCSHLGDHGAIALWYLLRFSPACWRAPCNIDDQMYSSSKTADFVSMSSLSACLQLYWLNLSCTLSLFFPSSCLSSLFSFHCQSFSTVHKIGPDCSMYFYQLERASVLAFVYISYQATV